LTATIAPVRVVCQRVKSASVRVEDRVVAIIGRGLCLLVGIAEGDDAADVEACVDKIAGLRIFSDETGKMNLSVVEMGGELLVVSQFTLLGDVRRGRRPSFTRAADPVFAEPLIDRMVTSFRARGISTSQGVFGAKMEVELVNDGPVTLILDVGNATVR
jgi:D-tyrosyl-tRNA(Tyr) deacylase